MGLPLGGIGPLVVPPALILSALSFFVLGDPVWHFQGLWARAGAVAGSLLIFWGGCLWFRAVFLCRMVRCVRQGILMTSGAYAAVRNPLYTAFLLISTGGIFIGGCIPFLAVPLLYWGVLTLLLPVTEERWLREAFGRRYDDYCRSVPRCIPRFPRLF